MIVAMSPRSIAFVLLAALAACGTTSSTSGKNEPKNAKEKQALEKHDKDADGGKWTGWRYQGDRNDCFYVVGRKCFKTQKAACATVRCKAPKTCGITGGGPATVSCK